MNKLESKKPETALDRILNAEQPLSAIQILEHLKALEEAAQIAVKIGDQNEI
jgi:hypothetical protein